MTRSSVSGTSRPGLATLRAANALLMTARTGLSWSGKTPDMQPPWIDVLRQAVRLEAIAYEPNVVPDDREIEKRVDLIVRDVLDASGGLNMGFGGTATPAHMLSLAIKDAQGRYCLVRDSNGKLRFPLALTERDVTPQESVVRAAKEQLGINLELDPKIAAIQTVDFPQPSILETYLCSPVDGVAKAASPDVYWLHPEEFDQAQVSLTGRFESEMVNRPSLGFPLTENARADGLWGMELSDTQRLELLSDSTAEHLAALDVSSGLPALAHAKPALTRLQNLVLKAPRGEEISEGEAKDLERWFEVAAEVDRLAAHLQRPEARSQAAWESDAETLMSTKDSDYGQVVGKHTLTTAHKYGVNVVLRAIVGEGPEAQVFVGMVIPARDAKGRFGTVGGWVGPNESIIEAAAREWAEETGGRVGQDGIVVDGVVGLSPCSIHSVDRPFSRAEVRLTSYCKDMAELERLLPPKLDPMEAQHFEWVSLERFRELQAAEMLIWNGAGAGLAFEQLATAKVPSARAAYVDHGNPNPYKPNQAWTNSVQQTEGKGGNMGSEARAIHQRTQGLSLERGAA